MSFLDKLNPQQRAAVEHTEGPLLILAGAGSGKTRVITYRIVHLIQNHGVSPARLLAVTFTNKAAGEMRDRVASLLGSGAAAPWLSTFHSFCVRLLRRDGAPLASQRPGFTPQFAIYDEADHLSVVKAVCRDLGLDEKFMPYRGIVSAISHAKNRGLRPPEYLQESSDPKAEKIAVIYERYEAALRRANALDFDDLLLEAVRLLRHDEPTRRRLGERYHYLMVDEYQDTNRPQYALVRLLSGPRRNVCVVGDEDQSIYGWRGADIKNILDFERDYPGARVLRLEQNYRSTGNILDASGGVIAHNRQRKGKKLWTQAEAGAPILLYRGEDAENEALFIADHVEQYLRRNPGHRAAVLYRANFLSRQIEEALRRRGRKYLLVGGLSFYQRAEVKDLLAYLKAALSPQDAFSLLRILNTPARGIGKSSQEQIERHALEHGVTITQAIEDLLTGGALPARAQAAMQAFRDLMNELRSRLAAEPLNQILVWIADRTGYRNMLQQQGAEEAEGRLENINELINAAADAVERGETVHDFLDHSALVAETDDLDEKAQVTLLTLHSAKGLEFDLVILAGVEEGLLPHSRAIQAGGDVEEERRLCYVGMTRAQKQLLLTRAEFRRRFGGGEYEPGSPSRFLDEIPRELVRDLSPEAEGEEEPQEGFGVDLWAERREARPAVRRPIFTGKTYNSTQSIAQFFASRGRPAPALKRRVAPGRAKAAPLPRRPAGFRAGAQIQHPKFGAGTILRREGEGDQAKLTVSFPRHGLKKLLEKYATLTQE